MNGNRFVQIHFLTSYPASLLNRDDAGFAKRLPFGGATRTRVSSQCLKRHWRTFDGENSLAGIEGATLAVRSRQTFDRFIYRPLVEHHQIDEALAHAATEALAAEVLGKSAKRSAQEQKSSNPESTVAASLQTNQVTVLGRPELEFLCSEALALCAEAKDPKRLAEAAKKRFTRERRENLQALKLGSGLDAALFGRMVTGDILARVDAALHVAHAFTVHAEETESDYFTAVDELLREEDEGELGSGHLNNSELTSGLFYGYVAADLRGLMRNLGEDPALAGEVMRRLVHLLATVSPGAKLGSTAPHSYAHMVMAEASGAQPRTLANAFLAPVRPAPDLLQNTYRALAGHLSELDRAYGRTARRALALGPGDTLAPALPPEERVESISDLAGWVAAQAKDAA